MNKSIAYIVSEDWYFISHRLSLAKRAMLKGYQVHVICKNTGKTKIIEDAGFHCHELLLDRSNISFINFYREICNIKSILKRINPSILHLVALRHILLGILTSTFMKNIKIVSTITGLGSIFLSQNIKIKIFKYVIIGLLFIFFKKKNISIIVQNKDDYNFCVNSLKCNKNKIHLILGSGVNTKYFEVEKEPDYPPIIVTYLGRIIKDKGIENLIDAFNIVNETNKEIYLIIAGSIDYLNPSSISEEYIKNAISNNSNISWIGEVSNVKELWRKSHIAVLPSKREGLPKSLLEAAASGRAIIATDVPGCREVAINKVNAVTVSVDNDIELADAIKYLSKNHYLRKEFGLKGRGLVEDLMSEEIIIDKTISIYENLYIKA